MRDINIKRVKVENMTSAAGNKVANQFLIYANDGVYFQSYTTIIGFKSYKTGKITLDENAWDYSVTTGKYRNQFLREGIADTRKKIESGEYRLVNLN